MTDSSVVPLYIWTSYGLVTVHRETSCPRSLTKIKCVRFSRVRLKPLPSDKPYSLHHAIMVRSAQPLSFVLCPTPSPFHSFTNLEMWAVCGHVRIFNGSVLFRKIELFLFKAGYQIKSIQPLIKGCQEKKARTFAVGSSVNDTPVWNISASLLDLVNPEYGQQFMQLPKLGFFLTWRQRANQVEDGSRFVIQDGIAM